MRESRDHTRAPQLGKFLLLLFYCCERKIERGRKRERKIEEKGRQKRGTKKREVKERREGKIKKT